MGGVFEQVDSWQIALVLAMSMLAAWGFGWWSVRRHPGADGPPPESKFAEASLALLGLLLAFTFSMSLSKHEQRRLMVVADSNSIGDFYTCASLLEEPTRTKLQDVTRSYLQLKVSAAEELVVGAAMEKALKRFAESQNQMTDLVREAVDADSPVTIPLINTFNNLTSNHAARLSAVRDRLPWSIVVLLFIATLVTMLLIGQQQGATGKPHILGTLSFILVVMLVVDVTLDLNQPDRGMIRVSEEPFTRLLASIKA